MSGWCWLARVDEPPPRAAASAPLRDGAGACAGVLAVWTGRARPVRHALRMDARLLDAAGDAAVVSLVLAPAGVRLAFDDPAVQQARRAILGGPPFDAVSTLLSDASHFEGSVVVARGETAAARLAADPFARIFPALVLDVGAGLFGSVPPPAGPVIERYGSAEPWPRDRFPAA
jgi:hypothetical protein